MLGLNLPLSAFLHPPRSLHCLSDATILSNVSELGYVTVHVALEVSNKQLARARLVGLKPPEAEKESHLSTGTLSGEPCTRGLVPATVFPDQPKLSQERCQAPSSPDRSALFRRQLQTAFRCWLPSAPGKSRGRRWSADRIRQYRRRRLLATVPWRGRRAWTSREPEPASGSSCGGRPSA